MNVAAADELRQSALEKAKKKGREGGEAGVHIVVLLKVMGPAALLHSLNNQHFASDSDTTSHHDKYTTPDRARPEDGVCLRTPPPPYLSC